LHGTDYFREGITLDKIGLAGKMPTEIMQAAS